MKIRNVKSNAVQAEVRFGDHFTRKTPDGEELYMVIPADGFARAKCLLNVRDTTILSRYSLFGNLPSEEFIPFKGTYTVNCSE